MQDESAKVGKGGPLFKRACDACRARKVRCDKTSPCSACKASSIPCYTSPPEPRTRRKRVHVTEEYERKIDLIQERLADLDHTFNPFEEMRTRQLVPQPIISRAPSAKPTQLPGSPYGTPLSTEDAGEDSEKDTYEGGTSMRAHSAFARELLEKAVQDSPMASSSPAMASALASLKQLSSSSDPPSPNSRREHAPSGSEGKFDFRRLPLPPTEAVLDILRRAKEIPTLTFISPFCFTTIPQLTELCKLVFFSLDPYAASTAVLVHGHLQSLFFEFYYTSPDEGEKLKLKGYSDLCKSNLEISLANFETLSAGTADNVAALLFGACYGIEECKPSMAWKLTAAAASLLKAMGWHRAASMNEDSEKQRRLKTSMFWYVYSLDKSLSLRLGRASTLQDFDIDIELPFYGPTGFSDFATKLTALWVNSARVQSLVYEQLYSPAALKQSNDTRRQRVTSLLQEMDLIRAELSALRALQTNLPLPAQSTALFDMRRTIQLIGMSDEVVTYIILTMIHRAMPSDDPLKPGISTECLMAARNALESHQKASEDHRHEGDNWWSFYLHWTVLHAPFVPFVVVFCNVLGKSNRSDLKRLDQFVKTLADGHFSEGATKLHLLCSTLYQVAALYVEAHTPTTTPNYGATSDYAPNLPVPHISVADMDTSTVTGGFGDEIPGSQVPSQAWGALNPYLNTMGFAGDPTIDTNATMNNSLGDWFNGNQYIMGLLEEDISYMNVP